MICLGLFLDVFLEDFLWHFIGDVLETFPAPCPSETHWATAQPRQIIPNNDNESRKKPDSFILNHEEYRPVITLSTKSSQTSHRLRANEPRKQLPMKAIVHRVVLERLKILPSMNHFDEFKNPIQ